MRFQPTCIFCVILGLAASAPAVRGQPQLPFQDPNRPAEERITNILALLTLDEKVDLLRFRSGVPRLGIPVLGSVEGLHGEAMGGPSNWGRRSPHPTTIFPQAIGMAETWDTDAIHQAGAVEGYEVRYMQQNEKLHRGGLVVFAPNADLGRDPRWGRTEECYGEDPFFNGTMAVAFIRGLQGDNPKYWLTASLLKHFFANSNEDGRDSSSSNFDERLFREYYSVPFRMGFEEGGARCFMASYNAWNGIPNTVQPVIRNVAMREWGVDGIICTDGGAYRLLIAGHHFFSESNAAAAACVKAGINHFLDFYRPGVMGALTNGLVKEVEIDDVLRGVLRIYLRLGLLDPPENVPYARIGQGDEGEPWLSDKHKAAARVVTQKSIVLLKNAGHLLPLDKHGIKSIALIGPRSNEVLLDWYSGTPPYTVTPFEGIRNKVGPDVTLNLVDGMDTRSAVAAAKKSDVAIVCVGNHPLGGPDEPWAQVSLPSEGREAVDRKSIKLEQESLIKKVLAANPRTVVVLISSFPYAINWTEKHVPAIVHLTHCSQELGNALADVLFGDFNPAGRLVQTWPRRLEDLPSMMDYNIRHGRTYQYFKSQPLYAFGFGLSYTTFEYSNLRADTAVLPRDGVVRVSVDVQNTGSRAGDEVVQLYVKHLHSSVERPIRELRGFQRVSIKPGESRTVQIPLAAQSMAYWNTAQHRFVVEPERVQVEVGGSSDNLPLRQTIEVR